MIAHMLRTSSLIPVGRKPQAVRASVVPSVLHRHRHRQNPSLMAMSPLDAFFDLGPSHLLETEEFEGRERARPMAVDFVEDRDGFQIMADIPGVAKKDIKLDVDHNVVTISARRSSKTSSAPQATSKGTDVVPDDSERILQSDANVLRYERFDSFQSRSFRVPKTADLSTISAKYENGVLTVVIKKREDMVDARRTVDIA